MIAESRMLVHPSQAPWRQTKEGGGKKEEETKGDTLSPEREKDPGLRGYLESLLVRKKRRCRLGVPGMSWAFQRLAVIKWHRGRALSSRDMWGVEQIAGEVLDILNLHLAWKRARAYPMTCCPVRCQIS